MKNDYSRIFFTFAKVHNRIANGPTMPLFYRTRLTSYINFDAIPFKIVTADLNVKWETYKAEVDANRMSAICIWPAILNAHWVNGIGYRIYSGGTCYARIIDNWSSYNPLTDST